MHSDESLVEVKEELLAKVEAVDRKVDGVERRLGEKIEAVDRKVDEKIEALDRKVDHTRTELTTLITATATALETHMDKKLDDVGQRLVKAIEAAMETIADRVIAVVIATSEERCRRLQAPSGLLGGAGLPHE